MHPSRPRPALLPRLTDRRLCVCVCVFFGVRKPFTVVTAAVHCETSPVLCRPFKRLQALRCRGISPLLVHSESFLPPTGRVSFFFLLFIRIFLLSTRRFPSFFFISLSLLSFISTSHQWRCQAARRIRHCRLGRTLGRGSGRYYFYTTSYR